MYKLYRIFFIILSINIVSGQTAEELKRFMDTYQKIKVDQQANEVVKKGIDAEKGSDDGPVRLLIEPADVAKYYLEKMNVIKDDLDALNRLLITSDSIPPLSHFGYNYFSLRDSITFIDNSNVNSNYTLGYGDEIIISIWGQAEQYERQTLERDGTVFIENVGLLYLAGKTQIQAKDYVYDRFSKVYATLNSNPPLTYMEFSVGKIKNINISVAGHVHYPGNYIVNPTISIPNILILSGGISTTGTLRNILLQRNGSIVDTLDLYPLITGVGIIEQITIYEGDIIIVPPRGGTIAITGDILNPAYFELNQNEKISTLLKFSGVQDYIRNQQVIISRSKLENLYVLKENYNDIQLSHGDSLIVPKEYNHVKSISISITNRSAVEIPWAKDMTFSKIISVLSVNTENIKNVELIRRNTINNQQEIYPFEFQKSQNFRFLAEDHLSIQLIKKFTSNKVVVVKGEINSPGTYPLINSGETLSSILIRSGGLLGSSNMTNVMVKRDTLVFGSQTGELILTPGDTVIANPILGTVKIEGEVHNPGNFEWSSDIKAKDYLSLAGGLTTYGDKKHIVYITPYGEASRITIRSSKPILPGGIIRVSEKPLSEQNKRPDRFQQISSIVTSLVSIAILANTTK